MLLYFITDYVRDGFIPEVAETRPKRRVREAFAKDPDAVCHEYGISQGDLETLGQLPPQVSALLPATVRDFLRALNPAPSLLWPGPTLSVQAITPGEVRRGDVLLTINMAVDPPDAFDGSPFVVEPVFTDSQGEQVKATPILPIRVPPAPVTELSFDCRATLVRPGAYHGKVTVSKLGGEAAQPTKVAQIELGQLWVR